LDVLTAVQHSKQVSDETASKLLLLLIPFEISIDSVTALLNKGFEALSELVNGLTSAD